MPGSEAGLDSLYRDPCILFSLMLMSEIVWAHLYTCTVSLSAYLGSSTQQSHEKCWTWNKLVTMQLLRNILKIWFSHLEFLWTNLWFVLFMSSYYFLENICNSCQKYFWLDSFKSDHGATFVPSNLGSSYKNQQCIFGNCNL